MTAKSRLRPAAAVFGMLATVCFSLGACGSGTATSSSSRPTTPARIQIVQPGPNDVSGTDVHLVVNLIGAQVVQPTTGPLRPDQGHIHVSLDGQLVSMAYGTTQDLPNTAPGQHSIQVEFVATDHLPFANRVVASVLFTVKA